MLIQIETESVEEHVLRETVNMFLLYKMGDASSSTNLQTLRRDTHGLYEGAEDMPSGMVIGSSLRSSKLYIWVVQSVTAE